MSFIEHKNFSSYSKSLKDISTESSTLDESLQTLEKPSPKTSITKSRNFIPKEIFFSNKTTNFEMINLESNEICLDTHEIYSLKNLLLS